LPAVRDVCPLNVELFEAELTLYPDRAKGRASRKALDLVVINL